jgi:tRNA dimethylallyltransferase
VVIGGPTASGKSAIALALAENLQAKGQRPVILNADALQVYRDLSVLTARPDAADEARAPHRLYGVIDGATRGTVALWLGMIQEEIAAILQTGGWPIVVGGSGMYLHSLMNGLAIVPEIEAELRAFTINRHGELGGARFRAELATLDPGAAARLHDGDTQRLIRAYEVVKATGRTLEELAAGQGNCPARQLALQDFRSQPDPPGSLQSL